MRVLKYRVVEQTILRENDDGRIFKGTHNYLQLQFEFDDNWKNCTKAIVFVTDKNEIPFVLKNDNIAVPADVCDDDYIRFYLVGKKPNYRIQAEIKTIRLL